MSSFLEQIELLLEVRDMSVLFKELCSKEETNFVQKDLAMKTNNKTPNKIDMKVDMEIGVETTNNDKDQEADRRIETIKDHIKTTKIEETTTGIIIGTKGVTIIMDNIIKIKEDTELFYCYAFVGFLFN